jgi:hypothetical protein
MKKRPQIPSAKRKSILARNASMCCVCHARDIGVEIHHLDKNPANNKLSNLAVLCTADHDAHHRPLAYPRLNHLRMSKDSIRKAKRKWEWFVAEAGRLKPEIMATVSAYGTKNHIHAMRVVYQGRDQTIYLDRTFHSLRGPPDTWIDDMLNELCTFRGDIPIVLVNAPLPVEYCPCCHNALSRTVVTRQFDKIMNGLAKK